MEKGRSSFKTGAVVLRLTALNPQIYRCHWLFRGHLTYGKPTPSSDLLSLLTTRTSAFTTLLFLALLLFLTLPSCLYLHNPKTSPPPSTLPPVPLLLPLLPSLRLPLHLLLPPSLSPFSTTPCSSSSLAPSTTISSPTCPRPARTT